MKKVVITIVFAVLLGCLFAYFYFKDANKDVVNALELKEKGYAFQVGVFHNYENAVNEASKYPSGTVIPDGEFNRVYIGLGSNLVVLDKLKLTYNSRNINYYMRRIDIPSDFVSTFNMYEEVLNNTEDIDSINKQFLKEYSDYINGVHN